uniref:Uncharacterized protein n=1 Tax=Branchiostoma floridae TaxID=7739 RepID=C3YXP6_BRAFL|eukprot:XP_002598843.1 hypothetical protein BRAFLDRAFT_74480 [Branchiostoma floridae]
MERMIDVSICNCYGNYISSARLHTGTVPHVADVSRGVLLTRTHRLVHERRENKSVTAAATLLNLQQVQTLTEAALTWDTYTETAAREPGKQVSHCRSAAV